MDYLVVLACVGFASSSTLFPCKSHLITVLFARSLLLISVLCILTEPNLAKWARFVLEMKASWSRKT